MNQSEFDAAKATAMNAQQEALTDAYTVFGKAIDEIDREHVARMEAARAAFEAVKSDPTHLANAGTRAAFDAIRGTTPDYTEARAELDRAVRAADAAFNTTMARLREELAAA